MIVSTNMKKTVYLAVFTTVLYMSGVPVFAETVSVPDIETRIRNSGNEVPSSALPVFRLPPPVTLPEEQPEPVQEQRDDSVIADSKPDVHPSPSVKPDKPSATGHASVGSGYPGYLAGEFAVSQPEGTYPGFSARFGYVSADGYSGKDIGSGYFDRSVGLSLRAFSDTGPRSWYAAVSVGDRANGLQGLHPAYFSIAHRLAGMNAGVDLFNMGENGPLVSLYLDSQVFTSSAERGAADPLPGTEIDDYRGYYLSPGVRFTFTPGRTKITLDTVYTLDTVIDYDDLHAVSLALSALHTFGSIDIAAGAGFHTDTEDTFLVPFFARVDWNPADGLFGPLSLSGGLSSERRTVFDLARKDPYVFLGGLPVHAADWFGSLSLVVLPLTDIRLLAATEYRKTAFDRAVPVLTDSFATDGRVLWTVADRESLVVSTGIAFTGDFLSIETGYRGELMDELWASHLHELTLTVSVYDSAPSRFWAAEADSVFMLDSGDVPRINLSGRIRPLPGLTLTLTFEDVLPPLLDEVRMINDRYRERSGTVLLSGRFDF